MRSVAEIRSPFTQDTVTGFVTLYEGELAYHHEGTRSGGTGVVRLEPGRFGLTTRFDFTVTDGSDPISISPFGKDKLEIGDTGAYATVGFFSSTLPPWIVDPVSGKKTPGIYERGRGSGSLIGPIEIGKSSTQVAEVVFHVPNLPKYWSTRSSVPEEGRTEPWEVTIRSLNIGDDVNGRLAESGGVVLTHVGRLRLGGQTHFEASDAVKVLFFLGRGLSFVFGRWISPLLPVAFDADGKRVWSSWVKSDLVTRVSGNGIYDRTFGHCLVQSPSVTFNPDEEEPDDDGFASVLCGFGAHGLFDVHERVLDWYFNAALVDTTRPTDHKGARTEGAIVLLQAALESLAWAHVARPRGPLSQNGLKKLTVADQLRLLLGRCNVPLDFPSELSDLDKLRRMKKWEDGPSTLTEVRNGIAHGDLAKDYRPVVDDALKLGLWYVDLVMLWSMGYSGHYRNRITEGEETVPWSRIPT